MGKQQTATKKTTTAAKATSTKTKSAKTGEKKSTGSMTMALIAGRSLDDYLNTLEEPRRSEIEALHNLIHKALPKLPVAINSMGICYGMYHYKYATGREGDAPVIGVSSRKNYISLYVLASDGSEYIAEKYKARLPKAKIGKSCVTFKKLADVDQTTITELVKEGTAVMTKQGYINY